MSEAQLTADKIMSAACDDVWSKVFGEACGVFNNLRMNLWVIRSGRENHGSVARHHPSREIAPKELSSTRSGRVFPLVRARLQAVSQRQSPGRHPGSAQAHRVSPTAHDLLSTGPVDN